MCGTALACASAVPEGSRLDLALVEYARIMRGDTDINFYEQVRKSHTRWAWNKPYRAGSVATLEALQTTDYIPRRQ